MPDKEILELIKDNLEKTMILSSTANGTYKRGEFRWVRNLHQIMLIYFWQSGRNFRFLISDMHVQNKK